MELAELVSYAEEKYLIHEHHKWADFPGFSVLADPVSGKWLALLMRQWDSDSGVEIQRADIKCGRHWLEDLAVPGLSAPWRMKGDAWLGVVFDARTEPALVFQLFDRAVAAHSGLIVLDHDAAPARVLPAEAPRTLEGLTLQTGPAVPERIRTMLSLGTYPAFSFKEKCKTFYLQAVFMENYTDDVPYDGTFRHYFPTYRDLTLSQLRGYFTWRTALRRGDWQPIAPSLAYLYLYELLNGVGAASPEDAFAKMQDFATSFIDSGLAPRSMAKNLRRWMFDFAVLHALPQEMARAVCEPEVLARNTAFDTLVEPEHASDEAVFDALVCFAEKDLRSSPLVVQKPAQSIHLFAEVWREAQKQDAIFTRIFGAPVELPWQPLSNAIYWQPHLHADADYALSPCHCYRCRDGNWTELRFAETNAGKRQLTGFLHETERLLRKHLKIGRPLREKSDEAWVRPYVTTVLEAEREAARPRVTIDLSQLSRIRDDAAGTTERLLTDSERDLPGAGATLAETSDVSPAPKEHAPTASAPEFCVPGLDALHSAILAALLRSEDIAAILRTHHLFPSIVCDTINAALLEDIGDTILDCDGATITLIDDYKDDLIHLIGGIHS